MKIFLKRITLVLLVFSLGLTLFVFSVHLIIRHASNFEIEKDKKYLVFGHSHSECAYDDTILKGFRNLSSSGEGYFYTYQKIKQVLEANSGVRTIFLEFTNYASSSLLDRTIWGEEPLDIFFPWHSSFLEKEDYTLLFEKNSKELLRAIPTSTRDNLSRILTFNLAIDKRYGRFFKFERIMPHEEVQNAKNNREVPFWLKLEQQEANGTKEEIIYKGKKVPSYNLKYLLKIIDFCKQQGVKVYLVRSPQHNYYPRDNESDFIEIRQAYLNDIEFFDFDRFPLDDSEYGDTEHLNYKGAQVFSTWFQRIIEGGLLDKDDKSSFITAEIEKLRNSGKIQSNSNSE